MRLRILLLGLLHLILLLLWPYLSLQAQTPLSVDPYIFKGILDTTRVRVVYQLTYIIDVDKPQQKKTQELELLLGKRYELFRFDKEGFDKGFSVPNGSELNIPGYGLAASVFLFDRYSGQRQTFIKGVAPSTLSYTTEDTPLQWSLRPETKEILGHMPKSHSAISRAKLHGMVCYLITNLFRPLEAPRLAGAHSGGIR